MKSKLPAAEKFEEWFWEAEDGFQFKAERCFQWAQIAAEKPDTLNRFLTDWIKGAYEAALKYSKERKAFGKEIQHHQAIAFKLADMATAIEGARLLCLKAAWLKDTHQDYEQAAAMAKLYASEIAQWVTNEAVQIHGGYGYVKEYHVERMMRDAKITQIYEGTSEVQKIVISRNILAD